MPEIELPLPEEGRDWTETKLFRHIYSVTTIWIVEIGLIKLIGPEPLAIQLQTQDLVA